MSFPLVDVSGPAPVPQVCTSERGMEDVRAGGRSYLCRVQEHVNEVAGARTVSRTWISAEAPGGLVKYETECAAAGAVSKSAMTLLKADDRLVIGGRTVRCHVTEIVSESGALKNVIRTWNSQEVPGFTVRTETSLVVAGGEESKGVTEVIDFRSL
jgi:hypothetical protein